MFRLTREVRFAINPGDTPLPPRGKAVNGFGGSPPMTGLGRYFHLQVTLEGHLNPANQYLRNIKEIDDVVRQRVIPSFQAISFNCNDDQPPLLVRRLFALLRDAWQGSTLHALRLGLTPFQFVEVIHTEHPMVRLSQRFEFSATHRLHNPALSDDENCRIYGKCNNPHGHGHNYEVQVTLKGTPDPTTGLIVDVPAFERIVAETVIDRFDHKNLNVELPEFRDGEKGRGLIPSVENIAMTIYRLLKPKFADAEAALASVTVRETPKTWCEYAEA